MNHNPCNCSREDCQRGLPSRTDFAFPVKCCRFAKPRPWGIKGENVNFLPRLSPAAKSFTPFIGVYIAR